MIGSYSGRESKYKVVTNFVERKNRANYYMWQCKLCNEVFGPTAVHNILKDAVGVCCKGALSKKERAVKYQALEGTLATEGKRLVSYVGETEGKFPHPLFTYACVNCEKTHGPNQLNMLKRHTYTNCCSGGVYGVVGYGVISTYHIKLLHSKAAKRSILFTVTAEYLHNLWAEQEGLCWYSGESLESPVRASLDRTDSSKGYVPGNVRWTTAQVNIMKWSASESDFLDLCAKITVHNERNKKND